MPGIVGGGWACSVTEDRGGGRDLGAQETTAGRAEKKAWSSLGDWTQQGPSRPRRPGCSRVTAIGVARPTLNVPPLAS